MSSLGDAMSSLGDAESSVSHPLNRQMLQADAAARVTSFGPTVLEPGEATTRRLFVPLYDPYSVLLNLLPVFRMCLKQVPALTFTHVYSSTQRS
jgi:hypothetical protein